MITLGYQWDQGSNSIVSKWVFSWEWGVVGVALELVPTSVFMLGSDTSQGTTEHLKENTPEQLSSCLGNGSPSEVQVAMLGAC